MKKSFHLFTFGLMVTFACYWHTTISFANPPLQNNGQPTSSLAVMLTKAMPAVVNVAAQGKVLVMPPGISDEEENDDSNAPSQQATPPSTQTPHGRPHSNEAMESIGSGVVIDAAKGYVITNAHLLREAQSITVTLTDGRHFPAKLIGRDSGSDIAVLKIPPVSLTALPIGDSNKLHVGDSVVAIGNPFGLNRFGPTSTATSGIISALQRSGMDIENYENFIQTDASINPGNSGGALVNLQGELIGINTAILAPSGGNVGIGFAIPIDMANNIAQQLIKYGSVRRGLLGVLVQPLTPELMHAFAIPARTKGALVSQVNPNSPVEKAGLKEGDLIQKINNRNIESAAQVRNIVGLLRVGDNVEMDIWRDKSTLKLNVKIADPHQHEEEQQQEQALLFGIALKDYAEESPYHGSIKGIQITGLLQNSPAWRAGLRPGDIITSANREQVKSINEFKTVAKKNQKELLIRVLRGPGSAYIVVK